MMHCKCFLYLKGSDILIGRFFKGMAAGTFIGAAAGILLMPHMDRKTRKRIARAGKAVAEFTNDIWGGIRDMRR
jgi:gas vesicle protein